MNRHQKSASSGFGVVEVMIVVVVFIIIGVVAWRFMSSRQQDQPSPQSAQQPATQTQAKTVTRKTYKSPLGAYEVSIPEDWKVETVSGTDAANPSESTTLTTPQGTVVELGATTGGGRGGYCEVAPNDVAFAQGAGNACPSQEYLSLTPTKISGIYNTAYASGDSSKVVPSTVYLVKKRYMNTGTMEDPEGIYYVIGLTQNDDPAYPIVLNKPQMGLYFKDSFVSVFAKSGKFSWRVTAFAASANQAFFDSEEAEEISTVFATMKINAQQ